MDKKLSFLLETLPFYKYSFDILQDAHNIVAWCMASILHTYYISDRTFPVYRRQYHWWCWCAVMPRTATASGEYIWRATVATAEREPAATIFLSTNRNIYIINCIVYVHYLLYDLKLWNTKKESVLVFPLWIRKSSFMYGMSTRLIGPRRTQSAAFIWVVGEWRQRQRKVVQKVK
jgi:hypothetical protein